MKENFQYIGTGKFIFNGVRVNLGEYNEARVDYTKDSVSLVFVLDERSIITITLKGEEAEITEAIKALDLALKIYEEGTWDSDIIEYMYLDIYGEDRWFNSIVYKYKSEHARYSINKSVNDAILSGVEIF